MKNKINSVVITNIIISFLIFCLFFKPISTHQDLYCYCICNVPKIKCFCSPAVYVKAYLKLMLYKE